MNVIFERTKGVRSFPHFISAADVHTSKKSSGRDDPGTGPAVARFFSSLPIPSHDERQPLSEISAKKEENEIKIFSNNFLVK